MMIELINKMHIKWSHIITKLKLRISKVYPNKTHVDVKSQLAKQKLQYGFYKQSGRRTKTNAYRGLANGVNKETRRAENELGQ